MTHGRYHIRPRGGTAAEWTADNPILWDRELGVETDTLRAKLGDGATAWNDLDYAFDEAGQVAAETAARIAADANLQTQINNIIGVDTSQLLARSTDGSFGLSVPTGTGFEAIITANALEDFTMNGVAL